jgi:hypothetical protein
MIKKILLIIGGIVVVLIGIVAFLLWRLDPEELGQEVIRRVNEKGGMQLEAETFAIKPLQGIFIDNAHLSGDAPAGTVSAEVAKVIIEYELLPILQKELVINRIVVEQPQAELVSRPAAEPVPESQPAEAEPSADEPAVAEPAPTEGSAEAEGGFKPSVAIQEVRIENASVSARTEGVEGGEMAIEGLSLELHDFYVDPAATQPLVGLNARGGIRIDQIQADDMTIKGGRGDIGIHNGQVAVSDLGVETSNASLNVAVLDLDLRQDPPAYHLEAGGGFDLNSFVNAEGPGGFGPAAVSLTLDGAGPDPDGAVGNGGLRMEAGTVPAFPMVAKIEKLLGKSLITGTPYQVTDMNFTLANGVATIQPFGLVLENLQIGGAGTVNLDGPLNLRLDIRLPRELVDIGVLDGMIDGMTDEEGWTVIPFTVTGTTEAPDVDIDMSVAKEYAVGAAKGAVNKAVDSAVDSLKEKTRGLLRRDKKDGG